MFCILPSKDYIDYAVAFVPSLVALFVAWVAWRQFKLGRDKLRLDLYERRFAVYERTLAFYNALIGDSKALQSENFLQLHLDFIRVCRESQFLFESDTGIFQLLEDLQSRAFKVTGFKVHGHMVADDPTTLLKMSKDATDALSYFDTAIKTLEIKMTPYLNFRKVLG